MPDDRRIKNEECLVLIFGHDADDNGLCLVTKIPWHKGERINEAIEKAFKEKEPNGDWFSALPVEEQHYGLLVEVMENLFQDPKTKREVVIGKHLKQLIADVFLFGIDYGRNIVDKTDEDDGEGDDDEEEKIAQDENEDDVEDDDKANSKNSDEDGGKNGEGVVN